VTAGLLTRGVPSTLLNGNFLNSKKLSQTIEPSYCDEANNFSTDFATIGFSWRTLLHEISISSNLMEVYIINDYLSPTPQEQQPIIVRKLT
jgi:hypothetical protein